MKLWVTQKIIKQMCGDHSYKKGKELYRKRKVSFSQFNPDDEIYNAMISGNSEFRVTIEIRKGRILAECTCPTLVSMTKSCHHIAAALIGILETQTSCKTSRLTTDADLQISP